MLQLIPMTTAYSRNSFIPQTLRRTYYRIIILFSSIIFRQLSLYTIPQQGEVSKSVRSCFRGKCRFEGFPTVLVTAAPITFPPTSRIKVQYIIYYFKSVAVNGDPPHSVFFVFQASSALQSYAYCYSQSEKFQKLLSDRFRFRYFRIPFSITAPQNFAGRAMRLKSYRLSLWSRSSLRSL